MCARVTSTDTTLAHGYYLSVRRLIVLDDDPLTRQMLVVSARAHGFDAVPASTVEEANTLLDQRDKPTAILSDIDLREDESGIYASHTWASKFEDVQIIFMSGHLPDMIAGFDSRPEGSVFLQKPFSIDQLVDALNVE